MSKMREAAEQAYTISAFDYPSNPIGSRDWCLYWDGYQAAIADVKLLVSKQADDDGLWFVAQTAPEAYLQKELRKLHSLIEEDV